MGDNIINSYLYFDLLFIKQYCYSEEINLDIEINIQSFYSQINYSSSYKHLSIQASSVCNKYLNLTCN